MSTCKGPGFEILQEQPILKDARINSIYIISVCQYRP